MKSSVGLVAFGALVALSALSGCKEGKGDRCQVEADCQSPFVCNIATHTCQETTGGGIDATVPDAPPNAKFDAAPDAMRDAGLDAPRDGSRDGL